ncbi:phosphoribosylformylglycinamidine synthase subunit PurL [Caminibacter mediatlanticus]|uniref:Phosphoribosylformylglycinamidine synthase subunit PurL n=1 Tax=Caminibacter mediatlanticus TB-2 TaxID=391592 RepID=A0AAI9AHZ8_9BACT|nr:phosphoribosylformylglycinamidine synthase subunit PurL [Caminibacter mediatlanticus]EDM23857.1 phosphoribosylformylglycinamidine synthase subunit II [Caminibacter mediatlanticus TB-2]
MVYEIDKNKLDEILAQHKLSKEDYEHIVKILGREPNLVELGIFSAMWSEHCSYKSSKIYLKGFPTEAPWVIQGPGENAGVIDIGGNMAAVFKMESHNHPSFIEPYQGAATGVGGILRDVFTMGARPVANLNAIRFAHIESNDEIAKLHKHLLSGVVAGIAGYGNCIGVPTIGGETAFEDSYKGNILVNAFALGICKQDEIFYAKAEGVGNPVIYVGSKTGRDGLGGAVMSSDSFKEGDEDQRPTVQVGDPFTEKLLMEACLELFKTDYIVGIQDMGAAGLTSSSFEMASKSRSGLKMYLDKVPMREEGMNPYELMLSESQERMLICAKKGYEDKVIEIFKKYDLDAEVIGEVTDSGVVELYWHGEKVAEVPVGPITDEAPELCRPVKEPDYLKEIKNIEIPEIELQKAFEEMIKLPEVVDKAWIYEQYDSMVGTSTVDTKRVDGSVLWVKENNKFLGMSADCNARFCYINPRLGAAAAVMEAGRNVAVKKITPKAITDCLNFGNPENPEIMWQFKEACEGIKEACRELNTPVVSGNVSLYNENEGEGVYPTPEIAMVGVGDSFRSSELKKEGNSIYILGETKSEFGGSLYLKTFTNKVAGIHPEVDFKKELILWEVLQSDLIASAKDISTGGIAIAAYKWACISDKCLNLNIKVNDKKDIFSESLSRALVEIEPQNEEEFEKLCKEKGIYFEKIGSVGGEKIKINDVEIPLQKAKDIYFNTFPKIMSNAVEDLADELMER